MSKFYSALLLFRTFGISGIFRKLRMELYSQTKTLLLEKTYEINVDQTAKVNSDVVFRQAYKQDIEKIAAIWPAEFANYAAPAHNGSEMLTKRIRYRFERETPCFVACEGGVVKGAVWCAPWHYDKALSPDHRGQAAYEIRNLFTTEKSRGKAIAAGLLCFAMQSMAQAGKTTAYSRVLPCRLPSISMHKKTGFRELGFLTVGSFLGRHYCSLDESARDKAIE